MIDDATELHGAADTEAFGELLALRLRPGDLITLEGELGAGKTTLIRAMATALGVEPGSVSSPTFVSMQMYRGTPPLTIIHIDAYRMRDESQLESIGWDELLARKDAVIFMEWASRVRLALPESRLEILLEHVTLDSRRVTMRDRRQVPGAHRCRICGESAESSDPFCSPRCRSADLGRWFKGTYRVDAADSDDMQPPQMTG